MKLPAIAKLCHICFCESSIRVCNLPGIDQPQMLSQITFILLLLLATCGGAAQSVTNEGSEFFLIVPPVRSQVQDQFPPQLQITTSEAMNVTFTVSYNSPSHRISAFNQTFTASKGSVTKVNLPTGLRALTTSPANLDIAVNVRAEDGKTIVVYLLNEDRASTDIALLYPKFETKTNTFTYYAVSAPKADPELGEGERSFVGIIPTEDNCVVEVTPTASAFGFIFGVSTRDHRPGVIAKSHALQKNTVIFLSSEDDLTGTKVNGTCYLSVISGHQCAFYPANVQSCDGIMEQIPPTETWGFNFFLSPLAKRQSAGYRFIAGADNTVVTRRCNGSEPDTFTLTLAGNVREVLVNMPTYCHVESNQPLLVAQYSLGHSFGGTGDIFADPFVTLIAPVGQFNNKYNFILVESVTPQDVAQPVVFDPYLNLLVTNDCCQRNEILYDGQPLPSSVSFTDIACTGGEVCGCAAQFHPSISTGAHTLVHTRDSCGIGATLYAWQNQNSYGSMAGTRLDSLAAIIYCLNEPSLTVTEEAGVVEFTATRTGAVGHPDCIGVTVMDITTQGSSDVEPPPECCFAAGKRKAICTITIVSDAIHELDEMFNIRLNPDPGQYICDAPRGPNIAVTIVAQGCSTEEDSVWGIQWLAIAAGSIQSARCPGEGSTDELGVAYRRCLASVPAEWGSVDASDCESVAVRAVREKTNDIINSLEKSSGNSRVLNDTERRLILRLLEDLLAAICPADGIKRPIPPKDLRTIAKLMELVANLGEENGLFSEESNETQAVVADLLSIVLDERNTPSFAATSQRVADDSEDSGTPRPAVSILQSTERVANVIATTSSKHKPSFTISRPNIAINGQRFSVNNLGTGIVFPDDYVVDTLDNFRSPEGFPQIYLPQSFLLATRGKEVPIENDTIEVVNVLMKNIENYLLNQVIMQEREGGKDSTKTCPASQVVSAQILGYDGREVDSKDRAEITFPLNEKSQSLTIPPGKVKQFSCAFFNYSAQGANQTTGGWSYRGVETDVINTSHVRCIASHLTSFAVLVSIVPSVGEPPVLDYITYIGCSISLLCLLACIIFFLTLRKDLVERLHNFVHLNLCIALSLGLLFFLTGIQTATANIYACKVITALLHYFFLATFTWTLCEAVLVYILLVKVFGANDRKWIYLYLGLGWVPPIPVVVTTGGARHDYYLIRASFDQNHPHYDSIKTCWLPSEKGMIFAFVGPMVAIMLVNAVLLTISLVSLARSQCGRISKTMSKSDEKRQKYMQVGKQLMKTTIILVPLLGFTWIIGLFAVEKEGKVFAYLFVFANVFQGFFIFVLHVLRHEKVYGRIKSKIPETISRIRANTGSAGASATEGTHSSKFDMIDTRRKSSFAVEPEASIKYGVGGTAEETASMKLGEDLNVKLNGNHNSAEAREENELLAVVMVTFEVEDSLSSGSLEGQEEIIKEGSEGGNNGQQGQEDDGFGHGLTCAVANSGE